MQKINKIREKTLKCMRNWLYFFSAPCSHRSSTVVHVFHFAQIKSFIHRKYAPQKTCVYAYCVCVCIVSWSPQYSVCALVGSWTFSREKKLLMSVTTNDITSAR